MISGKKIRMIIPCTLICGLLKKRTNQVYQLQYQSHFHELSSEVNIDVSDVDLKSMLEILQCILHSSSYWISLDEWLSFSQAQEGVRDFPKS